MMVERSPQIDVGQLMKDLDRATHTLETMSHTPQTVSKQDLNNLIKVLQNVNANLGSSNLEAKKLVPEAMNIKIEKALTAILLFQRSHPEGSGVHRNVDQAIVSLSSSLNAVLRTFDKNLRDLRKYKIGQRVEKINKMMEDKQQNSS